MEQLFGHKLRQEGPKRVEDRVGTCALSLKKSYSICVQSDGKCVDMAIKGGRNERDQAEVLTRQAEAFRVIAVGGIGTVTVVGWTAEAQAWRPL